MPHPVLPQMPKSTEFGEGECDVGVNILIYAQVEASPSPNPTGFVVFGEGRGGADK